MAKLPQSPADLVIRPRDIAFGRTERHARWWLNGDPVATHFANAMSMTFPQGERFFMDAVRHYRDAVPDEMKPQVAAFLTQEAIHSREHLAFNRQVSDNGYDISVMDYEVKRRLDLTPHVGADAGRAGPNPRPRRGPAHRVAGRWRP